MRKVLIALVAFPATLAVAQMTLSPMQVNESGVLTVPNKSAWQDANGMAARDRANTFTGANVFNGASTFNGTATFTGAVVVAGGDISDHEARLAAVEALEIGNALAAGKIIIGSAAGLSTAVTPSGDATIATNGAVTIAANAIGNAEIVATAAIAHTKLAPVLPTYILVGDANSNAVAVAVSGAATLASTGALSTVGLTTNLTLAVTGVGGWTNVLVFTQGRLTAINP
jgi:hypothetical protein